MAHLDYLNKSVEDIDRILDEGFSIRTASQPEDQSTDDSLFDTAQRFYGVYNLFSDTCQLSCYITSKPVFSNSTRSDRVVSVQRGDIQFFVNREPSDNVINQISFMAGYPMGSTTVTLMIGTSEFQLFPEGGTAWAMTPEEDASIVAALKTNQSATIEATSARGTKTTDEFSLDGFNEALASLEGYCPN
mgnify:CR=1 FL=1